MTEWERTGNTQFRDSIVAGMESIAGMPYGLFSGPGVLGYDPKTKRLHNEAAPDSKHTSHLVTIMGGAEVVFELAGMLDHSGWTKAWLAYCKKYGAAVDGVGGGSNPLWHARLTAYAAKLERDQALAERAWRELLGSGPRGGGPRAFVRRAMYALALVGDQIPERSPLWDQE